MGVFDGNNRTISRATIRTSSYDTFTGVFSYLGYDEEGDKEGVIKNLRLENLSVASTDQDPDVGSTNCVGGLVGYASGTIANCAVKGTVMSEEGFSGGLVGCAHDSLNISNCYFEGTVDCEAQTVGGLIGGFGSAECTISHCYTACDVTGTQKVGGFVGSTNGLSVIDNCCSSGTVTLTGEGCVRAWAGGLAGMGGYLYNCYSTASVTESEGMQRKCMLEVWLEQGAISITAIVRGL